MSPKRNSAKQRYEEPFNMVDVVRNETMGGQVTYMHAGESVLRRLEHRGLITDRHRLAGETFAMIWDRSRPLSSGSAA